MHLECGVRIFGHGFNGNAPDLQQNTALEDRAGAAKKCGVPQIIAVLHQTVEQLTFVGHSLEGSQVFFKGIGREKMVRCLQHGQLGITQKPAHCNLQEGARRHVVAIENGHIVARHVLERGIDVARLGMLVVVAGDVNHTRFFGEQPELLSASIVQNVNFDFVFGPVNGQSCKHRVAHHGQRLVVGRNQHIDCGPLVHIVWQRNRFSF